VGPIMREGQFLFPSTQDVKFSHGLCDSHPGFKQPVDKIL
jgi:hypothetical protein